jgi:hypothetical protein
MPGKLGLSARQPLQRFVLTLNIIHYPGTLRWE